MIGLNFAIIVNIAVALAMLLLLKRVLPNQASTFRTVFLVADVQK
jgi:hypothetical protein